MADEKLNEEFIEVSGAGTDAVDIEIDTVDDLADDATDSVPPQYGVGPLSAREALLLGVWLAAFIVSFSPLSTTIGA